MQTSTHPQARRGLRLPRLLRDPFMLVALAILFLFVFCAAFAGVLYPGDPMDMVAPPLLWPGEDPSYPLGTDALGRDIAAGIVHGARISLTVGFGSALIALIAGVAVGASGGYFGGRIDAWLMRLTELFQTIPGTLLAIVILVVGGSSSAGLISLAIGLAAWPTIARLVRTEFLTLRERDFILSARCLGYSTPRIIFLEILPNALPSIIVATSIMVAHGILAEAGLSFLNLGDANAISWGSMIGNGKQYLRGEWFIAAQPGIAIILTVLALNIIGDRINDYLNPHTRQA